MDLSRKRAGRLVGDDGAVVPGVPQPAHDVDEFVRDLVTQVVLVEALLAEVQRRGIVGAGHDVPGGAAAAEMIERREGCARRCNGSLKLVETVAPSPTCCVTMPSAASSVIGSKRVEEGRVIAGVHRRPSRR